MKPIKVLTKGQLKKVRRRERLAAMTPTERKAHDKQRAENKVRAKIQKASPVILSQSKYGSFAARDDYDAIREMNAAAIRGHNPTQPKVKDVIRLTGEAYRKTPLHHNIVAIKELQDSSGQPEIKQPETYRFQLRKVRVGTGGNFDRYWNEAVKQKLNPYGYIDDIIARRKAVELAEQTARLGAEYQPEIKPVPIDSGITLKVAKNGFIGCSVDEWESK
ncbi:hypothetical protein EEAAV_15230 [Rahnella aceris]